MTKQAAIYARVSTPQQEQEATIESQVAALETYAKEQGYSLNPDHYFLDLAVSGAKLNRPALDRLRDLAAEALFSIVLCLSPDRLSRQYAHQWVLMNELQRAGVTVVFIDQPDVADDPQGQLFMGIKGLFAEYERAMITERLRRGKLYRIRQGELVNPSPPYGYRYIPVSQPNGGRWEPDPLEAEVVQQIYAWYCGEERVTIHQIVNQLNELGPKAPPRGRQWRYSTVQAILKQSAYRGRAYYNRTRTHHEAIGRPKKRGRGRRQTAEHRPRPETDWVEVSVPALLSESLWQQAQERLVMNKKFSRRNNSRFYLLRSLLVCDTCGYTLVGSAGSSRPYYRCPNGGKNREPGVPQHRCIIKGEDVEPLAWQAVSNLLRNPKLLADAWLSEQAGTADEADELERLRTRQRTLERQWTRLLDLYQDNLLDKETLAQRKVRLDTERNQLDENIQQLQKQQLQQQAKDEMLGDFETYCQQMLARLEEPTPETKQEVIRLLIDHIVVRDNEIIIKHIIPVDDDFRLIPGHRRVRIKAERICIYQVHFHS
jgi:site-specific DNA recombinase